MTIHARTHSGDRPHTCVDCERQFADSSSLARHRKVHAGVKPYKCQTCGTKAFSRKATLIKHAAVCSGDLLVFRSLFSFLSREILIFLFFSFVNVK